MLEPEHIREFVLKTDVSNISEETDIEKLIIDYFKDYFLGHFQDLILSEDRFEKDLDSVWTFTPRNINNISKTSSEIFKLL